MKAPDKGRKKKKRWSNGNGSERDVICPFFDQHSSHEIRCEGIMDDCMHIMAFCEAAVKNWYMSVYCKGQYRKCEYCRILMQEKYEET